MDRRESIHISTYDRPTMVDVNDFKGMFEPTTNPHQWSRWRMAVNDALCNHGNKGNPKERSLDVNRNGTSVSGDDVDVSTRKFSKFLSEAPYKEFVKVTDRTIENSHKMMITDRTLARDSLQTGQFIYFGIPRIQLGKDTKSQNVEEHQLIDVYIPDSDDMKHEPKRKVVRSDFRKVVQSDDLRKVVRLDLRKSYIKSK